MSSMKDMMKAEQAKRAQLLLLLKAKKEEEARQAEETRLQKETTVLVELPISNAAPDTNSPVSESTGNNTSNLPQNSLDSDTTPINDFQDIPDNNDDEININEDEDNVDYEIVENVRAELPGMPSELAGFKHDFNKTFFETAISRIDPSEHVSMIGSRGKPVVTSNPLNLVDFSDSDDSEGENNLEEAKTVMNILDEFEDEKDAADYFNASDVTGRNLEAKMLREFDDIERERQAEEAIAARRNLNAGMSEIETAADSLMCSLDLAAKRAKIPAQSHNAPVQSQESSSDEDAILDEELSHGWRKRGM